MERSSKSTRLPSVLCLLLLVASTSNRVDAQRVMAVSDSLRAATEELAVRLPRGFAGNWRFHFGEFAVSSISEGRLTHRVDTKGPLLGPRLATIRDDYPYQFVLNWRDSLAVRVRATVSMRAEVRRYFSMGNPGPDPNDVLELTRSTTAHLVYEDDSAAAWDLRIIEIERTGQQVPPAGYAFEGTVTSGARIVRLVQRTLQDRLTDRPEDTPIGYVLEEDGRPIAAVQYSSVGIWGSIKDRKVWLPKSGTARERLEWAAILATLLSSEPKKPHPAILINGSAIH